MNLKIIIFMVLFVFAGVGQVSGVGISSCTNITSSGTYVLTQDILNSEADICMNISASNVILDGAGHSITSMWEISNTAGVYVHNPSTALTNVTVKNLNVKDWWYFGIYTESSSRNTLINNDFSNNYYGIWLYFSSSNTLTNNTVNSNYYFGISLDSSNSNTLTDNTVNSNNQQGIWIASSDNNILTNNTVNSNYYSGIWLGSSNSNTVTDNNANSNNDGIGLWRSSSNTITNNTASNNQIGISLDDSSSSNNLTDNTANSNNQYGIWLDSSRYNNLTNNTANSNAWYGIYLYQNSNYNNLTNNTAINNDIGIHLESSSNNNLTNNTANSNAWYGILLRSASNYNNLTSNNASSNNYIGILLNTSSGNSIYNNFFNNTNNFYLYSSTNSWNTTKTFSTNIVNGPYLGGNYWAKPNGNGFSETCTDADNDGICDSSYTLASGNVDYLPLTTAPVRPSINLQLSYKNTIYLGNSTDIKINVFNSSTPITANITVKINGQIVAEVNTHEYTYTFFPDKIGGYAIEVTATSGNLRETKIGKIEVISGLSGILALNEYIEGLAYSEIDQAVYIPASKAVDLAIGYTTGVVANALMKVISPLVDLAGDFVADAYRDNLGYLADHLGYLYEEALSEILNEDVSTAIRLGFSSVEEHAIYFEKEILESIPFLKINEERSKITGNSIEFKGYIEANPQEFLKDVEGVRRIFIMYSWPITYVVETRPLVSLTIDIPPIGSYTIEGWTMLDEANFYDLVKRLEGLITFLALVVVAIIVVAAFIIAAWASASTFGALLPVIAGAITKIILFITAIKEIVLGIYVLVIILLIVSIPLVVPQVTEQHNQSIEVIKDAVSGGVSPSSLSVQAEDTGIFSTTQIKSTGHTIVLTPDGKIVRIFRGDGYYTPRTVGEYKVYSFTHTSEELFYDIASTSFNVSKPNVTMNISSSVTGTDSTITASVCNHENATIGNLTLILSIKNSTETFVHADAKLFDLDSETCNNFDFAVSLNESDVYTATASLTIMTLFSLQEEKFPITIENATAEDVIIRTVEYKDIYSPFENITMNVTLQSLSDTKFDFDLNITQLNYSKSLTFTGIENITITLPQLPPEEYMVLIKAIKNDTILDSEIVKFTVEAIDVAILTFNTTKILYNSSEDVAIDLILKNLSGNSTDADVKVKVAYPNGSIELFDTPKSGEVYRFNFTPQINGTYILEGIAEKEGYRIKGDVLTIIIEEMSRLKMNVNISGDIIVASVFANGMPVEGNVTVFYDNKSISKFSNGGKAIFNLSDSFVVVADKMFYEPAYFEYIRPIASFTFTSPTMVNQTILFNASSSYDPNGYIIDYTWDFGDGNIMATILPTVTHIYTRSGTYNVTLTVTDNDGLSNSTTPTINIITTFNITLSQGWNLISLPLMPENTSLDAVLASIEGNYSVVYRWADCIWTKSTAVRNPLAEMTVEYGYWIDMTAPDTLELNGTQPALTTINVTNACWNLVGYPSLTPENLTTLLSPINYTVVYAYINGTWKKSTAARNPLTEMSPGYGYWIDANKDGSYEVVNITPTITTYYSPENKTY